MNSQDYNNYSAETGKYRNPRPSRPASMDWWEGLRVARELLMNGAWRAPQSRLPEVQPDLDSFRLPGAGLKFIWLGHSTLLINLDGQIVLIDPVFSKTASPFNFIIKRFQPAVLFLEDLPEIDVVVISHDHYDHLDKKTIQFFRDRNTCFLVPRGVGRRLRNWKIPGSRISELGWGESRAVGGLTYTAAPARHYSGRWLFDNNTTLWASWIIQGRSEKVFYSGDSSYSDHFRAIGNCYGPFDLAFMENGQYDRRWPDSHMMPEESVQAVIDVKAHRFVPVHWGMFSLALHSWSDPVERAHQLAISRDVSIITPRLGEVVNPGSNPTSYQWWESMAEPADRPRPTARVQPEAWGERNPVLELGTE